MSDPFDATAYKRRGDVVADVEAAEERYRIVCADCTNLPVIATIYEAPFWSIRRGVAQLRVAEARRQL